MREDFRKFLAKTNDKNEVTSRKPSKKLKNCNFLTLFGQKIPNFEFFPRVQLLTHTSRHLGEDLRKFQPKPNTKIGGNK